MAVQAAAAAMEAMAAAMQVQAAASRQEADLELAAKPIAASLSESPAYFLHMIKSVGLEHQLAKINRKHETVSDFAHCLQINPLKVEN